MGTAGSTQELGLQEHLWLAVNFAISHTQPYLDSMCHSNIFDTADGLCKYIPGGQPPDAQLYQIVDQLSWLAGKHSLSCQAHLPTPLLEQPCRLYSACIKHQSDRMLQVIYACPLPDARACCLYAACLPLTGMPLHLQFEAQAWEYCSE